MKCPLCDELVVPGFVNVRRMNGHGEYAHRECLLRSVVGGIGHHENHQLWCVERGDPDGGRTYRQSAIEVDEWIHTYG